MEILRHKYFRSFLLIVAGLTFLAVYLWTAPDAQEGSPRTASGTSPQRIVEKGTEVYLKETYALCKKSGFSCGTETLLTGTERKELNNLAESEIISRYPPDQGWTVAWQGTRLYLEKIKEGLCPEHQKRWHLGLNAAGDKVAVYLGPSAVGMEGGIVRETDLLVASLPEDIRQRIREQNIEFLDWEELIATLDSLSEFTAD